MIAHVAEVWGIFAVAFVAGCIGGAVLFRVVARGSLAAVQSAVSNAIAVAGDGMRLRLGAAPAPIATRRSPAREARPVQEPVADAVWDVVDRTIAERTTGPELEDNAPWLQEARDLDEPYVGGELGGGESEEEQTSDDVVPDEAEPAIEPAATEEAYDEPWEDAQPLAARANGSSPLMRSASQRLPFAGGIPSVSPPRVQPSQRRLVAMRSHEPPEMPGGAEGLEIRRPALLKEPRNGVPDNLQRIRGIGERNEVRLNRLGIFHFSQIASWTPAEVRWIGQKLAFPERIERDDWVGQAITLGSGRETGFTKSAERRRARRRTGRDSDGASEDVLDEN